MFPIESLNQDQYHLGFTMRFPRAIAIRDDLTIADCMTATGNDYCQLTSLNVVTNLTAAVLESMKSERKRKMEDTDSWVSFPHQGFRED